MNRTIFADNKNKVFKFMDKITISKGKRPLILVTNDDGIQAKGLKCLAEYIMPFGDVVVVAPNSPRSGQSAAITAGSPLRLSAIADQPGYKAFETNGTPTDCVKIAMNVLLRNHRPDLLVSGINHGSNSGVSVIYSGTMGAVFEGIMQGIPSIGFSLCDYAPDADFSICEQLVSLLCRQALALGMPDNIGLNVNIPVVEKLNGVRVCRAARGMWTEEYDSRIDPHGRPYYWLTGRFLNAEPDCPETDEYHLAHGYASIVPVTPDRTAININHPFITMLGGEHPSVQ